MGREGQVHAVGVAVEDRRRAPLHRQERLVGDQAALAPARTGEQVAGRVAGDRSIGLRTGRPPGRGVLGGRPGDRVGRVAGGVADHLVGPVGQRRLGEERRHQVQPGERRARLEAHGQHPLAGLAIAPVVEVGIPDRLLVRDALAVDAADDQGVDPAPGQLLPLRPTEDPRHLEQPDRLVQGVVAGVPVERRVGQGPAVQDEGIAQPDGHRNEVGGAGEDDGPERRRVVVPGPDRTGGPARVVGRPVVQEGDASVEVGTIAGHTRRAEQVQDVAHRVEAELPRCVVERILGPAQVRGQVDDRQAAEAVAVGQQLVGALDRVGRVDAVRVEGLGSVDGGVRRAASRATGGEPTGFGGIRAAVVAAASAACDEGVAPANTAPSQASATSRSAISGTARADRWAADRPEAGASDGRARMVRSLGRGW